ncbi:2-phospho-L-lactate guanylyltransferase [Kibdelosporangium phytohabitans]|uniref:Phosphoenolpyruvate guanylyltransferase n=1 Tax=Kibdelosporangium phytohabitans TaxID=860235 RepID=A0A0N9I0C0_9PSEU|nr:2-phospho-L-lactate guanylyltransferase [Kibdelosporangium phytohabitans]ALG13114.1 2-phospho-L-lactate guanylyltransferase [Kibdelosporangium phytohabitans]MBE1464855.1 2-phospho-L-lactate guanylyltransferase [Kibdelosporangium phytohabitans]
METDLVVPVKALPDAKSRLRGAVAPDEHANLVLAVLLDTVTAAGEADGVRRVLVVSSDPTVASVLAAEGFECVPEGPARGLNEALRHGAALLRQSDGPDRKDKGQIGALQADLPALRPDDLAAAIKTADGRRAFCADRQTTGTTLLLSAAGHPLNPMFGVGSALAHAASGALPLTGQWPSLRCDVDTAQDLAVARELGLGLRSTALLCAMAGGPIEC